jgi:transcriptional regulator with XRE-family HTH domain
MPAPGPVGHNVIVNVERLRRERGWSWRRLSAELDKAGRPIPPLGLSRMAAGERRVDVDELVTLAQVLEVAPDVLLSPLEAVRDTPASAHPAAGAASNLASRIEQLLAASGDSADREALPGYVSRALRRVQIEVEELLEETAGQAREPNGTRTGPAGRKAG